MQLFLITVYSFQIIFNKHRGHKINTSPEELQVAFIDCGAGFVIVVAVVNCKYSKPKKL